LPMLRNLCGRTIGHREAGVLDGDVRTVRSRRWVLRSKLVAEFIACIHPSRPRRRGGRPGLGMGGEVNEEWRGSGRPAPQREVRAGAFGSCVPRGTWDRKKKRNPVSDRPRRVLFGGAILIAMRRGVSRFAAAGGTRAELLCHPGRSAAEKQSTLTPALSKRGEEDEGGWQMEGNDLPARSLRGLS